MKSVYELALLYHPDLELDLDKTNAKIEKLITDQGGEVKGKDVWGKRKLTYKIKAQARAIYVFYNLEIDGQKGLAKLEASLNICDEVIRYLMTKPDLKAIARAKDFKAKRKPQDSASKADKEESSDKPEKKE